MLVRGDSLTDDESEVFSRLSGLRRQQRKQLDLLDAYYEGEQRIDHIGIAVPRELQDFSVVVNVPRMAVDEPVRRQKLRAFQRRGSAKADSGLREAWEANNLDSQAPLVHRDARIYGRTFVTVSERADSDIPLISVEDPKQFSVIVDSRVRRITGALRMTRDPLTRDRLATLYLPDETLWLEPATGGWAVRDRARHGIGQVPVVMFLNKPRALRFDGTTEMADVMKKTDAIARMLTNMQIASETHAVPARWVAGMSKGDFIDKNGRPIPAWEAYFTTIMSTENTAAKFGQFSASDLKNFHDTVNEMLSWCAAVLGLPVRYMGQQTVNPATEGAIRADESRLIANVEGMNASDGDSWAWVMALYERFRTGRDDLPANEIRAMWENPATPTMAEIADANTKLYAQGIVSREGVWDSMGWDEARKDRERAYLDREASEGVVAGLLRGVTDGVDGSARIGGEVVPGSGTAGDGGSASGTAGAGAA